jgi:hypothetical protein
MKIKFLFWSAVLCFVLGLSTKDSTLFYFFSIHLLMLFIGVLLHKLACNSRPRPTVEPLPEASQTGKN